MIQVRDKFGEEVFIGTLVAVSTNSGMHIGKITKFNTYTHSDGHEVLTSFQTLLTTGRKQSYDGPEWRMINLERVQQATERYFP